MSTRAIDDGTLHGLNRLRNCKPILGGGGLKTVAAAE